MSSLPPLPEIPLGIYRHAKGHLYRLLQVGRHSETLEPVCIYTRCNEQGRIDLGADLWVRPATMWSELVQGPGACRGMIPRFTKIELGDA